MSSAVPTDVETLRALVRTLTNLTNRLQAQLDAYPHSSIEARNLTGTGLSTGTTPADLASYLALLTPTLPVGFEDRPWYIIIKGRRTGVFQTIEEVDPLTRGVSYALSSRCENLAEAVARYAMAWDRGDVTVLA